MILLVVAIAIATWLRNQPPAAAAPATFQIQAIEFARTRTTKATGESVLLEQGTHFLAPDGRQRIDRNQSGFRTVEIMNYRQSQRIFLDVGAKTATVTSMKLPFMIPNAPGQQAGTLPFTAPHQIESASAQLGDKYVSGLLLHGQRDTFVHTVADGSQVVHTIENWIYQFPNRRIMPAILEQRFEDANEIDERQITNASTIVGSDETFLIPNGFVVK
jgi:hypothetical protein